jgi:ABC-type dipeptide/oligopeptide/nickel transport system permease component
MFIYICKRMLGAIMVLFAVSFITFVMLDLTPGDAAERVAGTEASAEQLAELRTAMGLNEPLILRYGHYIGAAILQGNLGESLVSGRPVSEMLAQRFGYTAILAFSAVSIALIAGTLLGMLAASRPGGRFDLALMMLVALGQAMPTFWVALLLIMIFALYLNWLPVVGAGTLSHLILPTIALALPTTAVVTRLVRASMLDVCGADYVRTARSKGLADRIIWQRHLLRNGLVPVATLVGLHLGYMLGGAFIVETIFSWPGLGRLMVQAIFDRDLPVIAGAVLLFAVIIQLVNLAVDILQLWLDPRLRMEEAVG